MPPCRAPLLQLLFPGFCEIVASVMLLAFRKTQPALLSAFAGGYFLFSLLSPAAEQRVFTNAKGQEIIAEIVSARGDTVVLRKDGREIETAISIYSAEDQAYIRKWMQENPAPIDYSLVIQASKKKIGRIGTATGYYNRRESNWAYYITVENRSRDTATGLTLEYRMFKESNVTDSGYPRWPREISEMKGSVKIPDLVTNRSAAITTESLILLEITYDTTSDYADELMGMLLRIVDPDGKVVAEFKEGAQEITRQEWESKPSEGASSVNIQ